MTLDRIISVPTERGGIKGVYNFVLIFTLLHLVFTLSASKLPENFKENQFHPEVKRTARISKLWTDGITETLEKISLHEARLSTGK